MKKTSIIIFCLGLILFLFFESPLYFSITNDGLGGGYGAMFIGGPLILIGIILFIISLFIKKK
ncbi:MAG TPA: hypothetical protein VJI66_00455 [Candidatus Paceibacterota bacterium]